jgi:hypothetical protein
MPTMPRKKFAGQDYLQCQKFNQLARCYTKTMINVDGNELPRKEGFENFDTNAVLTSGDVVFGESSSRKSA